MPQRGPHSGRRDSAAKRPAGRRRTGAPERRRAAKDPAGHGRPAAMRRTRSAPASMPREARRRSRRGPRTLRLATGPFRLWSAFCLVAFVISLFAARLVQLQGIDENDYATMAAEKGAKTITLEAPRAPITDRNGVPLAQTVDAAKLVADPTFTEGNATAIAALLHKRIGVDYIEAVRQLRKPDTRYVELARHLRPRLAASVVSALNSQNLPGVYADDDTQRLYPAGDVAANLVGFIGADGEGLAGLEYSLDDTLSGEDGSATFEMADGQQLPLADHTVVEPQDGTGIRLTIDQDLQFLAQRRLAEAVEKSGGSSGVAVILDVRTGQLLALADYPTYDPNQAKQGQEDSYGSRALQDVYEPGSVEKVLTFASLIDAGYVTPRTRITVPPVLDRGEDVIHDYFTHPTLRLTAAGVLAKSSNIGTVRAAQQMPKRELYQYLRSFGLGSKTGLPYVGESRGLLPPPQQWQPITRDTVSFGQGLSVNAVQMAAAIGAVANGGTYVEPSLVDGYVDGGGEATPPDPPKEHRVIGQRAADAVARMMELVTGDEGTAPAAAIEGYRVAGKTGTAQRVDESCGCYLPGSFTVSFAGFAPADDPRFAVYVVVQEPTDGNGGGGTGGPVFHDLMAATLQKFGVPPTGTRPSDLPVEW